MELTFEPPQIILWIIIAVFVVTVISMLLKRGEWPKKIAALVITIAVCGGVLFFFYRTTTLTVTEEGLSCDAYGDISFTWNQVEKVILIEELRISPYKPSIKINGMNLGENNSGWFTLNNGLASWILTQNFEKALFFKTEKDNYLFALNEMDQLIKITSDYKAVRSPEE